MRLEDDTLSEFPDLDRYELLDKMGDGAFSTVYKAFDRQTKNYVAVKVVRKYELNKAEVRMGVLMFLPRMRRVLTFYKNSESKCT